jgi:hypothetical protein
MGNIVGIFTQEEKQIIIGKLLGDGYLRIQPRRTNAILGINHSVKQKDYVDWLYQRLKKFVNTPPKIRKSNGGRIAYRFTTRQHSGLTVLFKKFYLDNKKSIPREFHLTPLILAIWFMDDGSKSHKTYYLDTDKFDIKDQIKLQNALISYSISSTLNRSRQYFRIRIATKDAQKFTQIIRPYVIPSMLYKLV